MAEEKTITTLEGELKEKVEEILSGEALISGGMVIVLPQMGSVLSQSMVSSRGYGKFSFRILRRNNGGDICDTEMRYSPDEGFVMEDLNTYPLGNPNYQQKNETLGRKRI